MKPTFLITTFCLLTASILAQNAKHPFTFEDMMKLKRVGAPEPSPDGKWVAFDCIDVDLEANTKISHLWIVSASRTDSSRGEHVAHLTRSIQFSLLNHSPSQLLNFFFSFPHRRFCVLF